MISLVTVAPIYIRLQTLHFPLRVDEDKRMALVATLNPQYPFIITRYNDQQQQEVREWNGNTLSAAIDAYNVLLKRP
jgi:hypothetical protein